MAWIYFQGSEASPLGSKDGLEQSPTVSKTDIAKVFFCPECQKVTFTELPSGTMSKHYEAKCCRASTSSLEVFHARTLVWQVLEKAWQESEVDFSSRLSGSQKKYVRLLCFSKTSQQLELEDFERSSEHLPKSGMTVDGRVFLPQALELPTKGKDGSYLPTITASSYGTQTNPNADPRPSLETMARKNLWPTPTVHGNYQNKKQGKSHLIGLATAVKETNTTGGQLSPMWVEWLMGYQTGHTELKPWAMEWFHNKSKKLSKS